MICNSARPGASAKVPRGSFPRPKIILKKVVQRFGCINKDTVSLHHQRNAHTNQTSTIMKKEIKEELKTIKSKGSKLQIKKALNTMKAENKIADFAMFPDGVNVYDQKGIVVFEINF